MNDCETEVSGAGYFFEVRSLMTELSPPGGTLRKKLGVGVQPASQNPYPIYDQNLRYSLPYL